MQTWPGGAYDPSGPFDALEDGQTLVFDGATGKIKSTGVTPDAPGEQTVSGPVTATQFKLADLNTAPAAANSTGTKGEIVISDSHIYVCVATDTWKRVAIATWP